MKKIVETYQKKFGFNNNYTREEQNVVCDKSGKDDVTDKLDEFCLCLRHEEYSFGEENNIFLLQGGQVCVKVSRQNFGGYYLRMIEIQNVSSDDLPRDITDLLRESGFEKA